MDPGGRVTGGQLAAFVHRLLEATDLDIPAAVRDHTDGSASSYAPAVNRLIELGAFNAERNDPNRWLIQTGPYGDLGEPITRWDMADPMTRAMAVHSGVPTSPTRDSFDDPYWDGGNQAKFDMLGQTGISAGTGDRMFRPDDEH